VRELVHRKRCHKIQWVWSLLYPHCAPITLSLLVIILGALGDVLGIVTRERILIEDTFVTAVHQTWIIVDASDETTAITGNRVAGIWQELTSQRVGRQSGGIWALETDDLLRVASDIEKEIGPVADVVLSIVSLSFFARNFFSFSISATVEVNVTSGRDWELTESVFAIRRQVGRNQFVDTVAAVDVVPVIFAIVMNATFTIEQKSVLASLQSQSSIFAFIKLVAILGMRVQLQTVPLGARRDITIRLPGSLRFTGNERDEHNSDKDEDPHD